MLNLWSRNNEDTDRFSFEDSDRFEEDSLCSWSSEHESLCNNWRGWKKPNTSSDANNSYSTSRKSTQDTGHVVPLCELAACVVASHIPFEVVEHVYPPVPEQLQLLIAFWSFPDNEEDIRLYSCLANSSSEEYQRGENLFKSKAVKEPLQIGFHLSATVLPPTARGQYNVAVTFDRRRITSCNCTCQSPAYWCAHIVAVCLHRIHLPHLCTLRAPVSESLSRLRREQLQKFAQYLISELPQQILPTAQRLLDDLLSPQPSAINSVCGAPDPTAGASANEQTAWYLDEKTIHDNIKKILIKFCVPAPMVFSDVNYLTTTAPPAASEWSSLLRPLRGREPEGMWNLLSIVREMLRRNDGNALPLLEIVTEECMACEQGGASCHWPHNGKHGGNMGGNTNASQHAGAALCDEIVVLWRLAALNPGISPDERSLLERQFKTWHMKIVEKVMKSHGHGVGSGHSSHKNATASSLSFKQDVDIFSGFKPAIEACYLDWDAYPIPGITCSGGGAWLYHTQPFTAGFKHTDTSSRSEVNSSHTVVNSNEHHHHRGHAAHMSCYHYKVKNRFTGRSSEHKRESMSKFLSRNDLLSSRTRDDDGVRSSVSSEGFCENNEPEDSSLLPTDESDSQEGGGSDSSASVSLSRPLPPLQPSSSLSDSPSGDDESDYSPPPPPASVPPTGTSEEISRESGGPSSRDITSSSSSNGSPPIKLDVPVSAALGASQPPAGSQSATLPAPSSPQVAKAEPSTSEPGSSSQAEPSAQAPAQSDSSVANNGPSSSNVASSSNAANDDDYNVYYYDPNAVVASVQSPDANAALKNTYESIFANLNKTLDPWEILFARAEGLHAHGHSKEACKLGVRLAEELLANPPNLTIAETPPTVCKQGGRRRNKHINPASWHQVSVLSSNTLQKCAFLCSVLSEYEAHHHLAFRVVLYGLEMARPPASTKPLEVKLAHQESELVGLLKRIPLGPAELDIIRDRATQLKDGVLRSRGDALLPITLAGFILDALTTTANQNKPLSSMGGNNKKPQYNADEVLGFEAAVAALGLKANVSEAEHPLLCEGTRRQRGELAVTLLVQYKDEPVKIARIMDKLLDREVHQLIKTPVVPWYYSNNPYLGLRNASGRRHHNMLLAHRDSPESQQASGLGSNPVGVGDGLDASLASMCLNPPPSLAASAMPSTSYASNPHTLNHAHPASTNQTSTNLRKESSRFKKRNYPCGNASTSLFTQPSPSTPHHGSHRGLHMCAFQLGLYALGLHNCVSHNWLSRTYSSHVSWLSGQAMELGTPAILFLIDTWEGHLTPPEAASIADKASRGCDPNMTRGAAELALSCLPHAHALNPNEITRAILQCKEQSDLMLEHACLLVENAAKGGGVYPEVLFQVAKYWFELYLRQAPPGTDQAPFLDFDPTPPPEEITPAPPPPLIEQTPPQFHHPMYLAAPPYSIIPTHWPPPHQMYLSSPPAFQYPPHSANQQPAYTTQLFSMRVNPHQHPQHHPAMFTTMQVSDGQGGQITVLTSPPHQGPPPQGPPPAQLMQHPPPPPPQAPLPNQQVRPHLPPQHQQVPRQQFRYLLSAYRVGMLAMDTLARRVHDDRPQAKYARNPPYGEDVKWLLRIAAKLGSQYLHQFCVCAVNSIISPFVLHDVAFEAAHYLSRNTPALIVQHLRTTLAPLMTKCQQMYIHCMNQKLYHLSGADHEDFVSIVCSARNAYEINPNGAQQFKEWLQSIRKSKSCKKDLWQQIQTALQNNSK
ncbi:hypothetical protein M8J75_005258 [Diaphorina citri]|nr:hypothetical protein M8J75_005258 [Diaphorina citri]